MDLALIFRELAISLGLGLLVGLQRESAESQLGGLRTFPLITLFGTSSALLAQHFGGWLPAAGLLAMVGLLLAGNAAKISRGTAEPGLTTEVAMLLMYVVGALLVVLPSEVGVVLGGTVAVLLHFKRQLHGLVGRLEENDMKAIFQFVLLSLVILPVLPNETYGPFEVFNPRLIWLLVVLIVGISLSGYIAYKFIAGRAGVLIAGLLGGVISSTATTVSYARRAAGASGLTGLSLMVIMLASSVTFVRVLIEIFAVAPSHFLIMSGPVFVMLAAMLALSAIAFAMAKEREHAMPKHENPTQLRAAMVFAVFFTGVLFAVAFTKHYLGAQGLYVVAAISGLTDMDAITLSTSRLVSTGNLPADAAWRLIILASISNLVFKAAIAGALGGRALLGRVAMFFGVAAAIGTAMILFWPG